MKISEIIAELQKAQKTYGDLEASTFDADICCYVDFEPKHILIADDSEENILILGG